LFFTIPPCLSRRSFSEGGTCLAKSGEVFLFPPRGGWGVLVGIKSLLFIDFALNRFPPTREGQRKFFYSPLEEVGGCWSVSP